MDLFWGFVFFKDETSILSMSQESNLADFAMRQVEIIPGRCLIVTFLRVA